MMTVTLNFKTQGAQKYPDSSAIKVTDGHLLIGDVAALPAMTGKGQSGLLVKHIFAPGKWESAHIDEDVV